MVDSANLKFADINIVNVQVVSRIVIKIEYKIIKNKFSTRYTKNIHKYILIVPFIFYKNTDKDKLDILKDNSKKTGVYK